MTRGTTRWLCLASTVLAAWLHGCERETPAPAHEAAAAAAAPHSGQHAEPMAHAAADAPAPLPGTSIYQLGGRFAQAGGGEFRLESLRGNPVLALMFYGTCEHACPILVHDLQRIDASLTPQERASLRFLLVSFDPERDTPERLAAYAEEHGLDPPRWVLLHGSPEQVRALSLVLGVRYRPSGDGAFSHTARITLLDRDGVVRAYADGLQRAEDALRAPLRALLAQAGPEATP